MVYEKEHGLVAKVRIEIKLACHQLMNLPNSWKPNEAMDYKTLVKGKIKIP